MSTATEDVWGRVIADLDDRPETVAALVRVLDRLDKLDDLKQRVLAEAAVELRADREATPTGGSTAAWLRQQLADGERRVTQLKADAARDSIGWRTIERAKQGAGVSAAKHGKASWWSLTTPPTPPTPTVRDGNLTTDG
jgi:hypothetical protein